MVHYKNSLTSVHSSLSSFSHSLRFGVSFCSVSSSMRRELIAYNVVKSTRLFYRQSNLCLSCWRMRISNLEYQRLGLNRPEVGLRCFIFLDGHSLLSFAKIEGISCGGHHQGQFMSWNSRGSGNFNENAQYQL